MIVDENNPSYTAVNTNLMRNSFRRHVIASVCTHTAVNSVAFYYFFYGVISFNMLIGIMAFSVLMLGCYIMYMYSTILIDASRASMFRRLV